MTQNPPDDIQVLKEDQERINRFSRLNLRAKELDVEIEMMKVCFSPPLADEHHTDSSSNMQGRT